MDFMYDHHCFVCGEDNPIGLKLKFVQDGEQVKTTFVPTKNFEGYPGILHGGIISTILDELMSQCVQCLGLAGLTARLEIRYRHSVPIGKPVEFSAKILKRKGPLVDLEAKAVLADGEVAAEASGRFMISKQSNQQKEDARC